VVFARTSTTMAMNRSTGQIFQKAGSALFAGHRSRHSAYLQKDRMMRQWVRTCRSMCRRPFSAGCARMSMMRASRGVLGKTFPRTGFALSAVQGKRHSPLWGLPRQPPGLEMLQQASWATSTSRSGGAHRMISRHIWLTSISLRLVVTQSSSPCEPVSLRSPGTKS